MIIFDSAAAADDSTFAAAGASAAAEEAAAAAAAEGDAGGVDDLRMNGFILERVFNAAVTGCFGCSLFVVVVGCVATVATGVMVLNAGCSECVTYGSITMSTSVWKITVMYTMCAEYQ